MAVVILGGLVSATVLNMIVVPAAYWKFAGPAGAAATPVTGG
jgi:Cu/Ag efflux pump CusA